MKKNDQIRTQITEKIVQSLQQGNAPWRKPWSFSGKVAAGFPSNFATPHKHYHGINPMILMAAGFHSRYWGTMNAWKNQRGFYIPRTEQPTDVVYYVFIDKKVNGKVVMKNGKAEKVPILRVYPLYNAEQIRVVEADWLARKTRAELEAMARSLKIAFHPTYCTKATIAHAIHNKLGSQLERYLVRTPPKPTFAPAEALIAATGADIRTRGQQPSYVYGGDYIQIPAKHYFDSLAGYYETVCHELVHWTEKKDRVGQREGHNYAFGELVAEIGACYLCFEIGVPHAEKMLENSSNYVSAWLKEMGNNPKYIFDAAAQASKSVDYLLGLMPKKKRKVA